MFCFCFSALKKEKISSSEILGSTYQIKQCHIPESSNISLISVGTRTVTLLTIFLNSIVCVCVAHVLTGARTFLLPQPCTAT
jgi:hypothetical protein